MKQPGDFTILFKAEFLNSSSCICSDMIWSFHESFERIGIADVALMHLAPSHDRSLRRRICCRLHKLVLNFDGAALLLTKIVQNSEPGMCLLKLGDIIELYFQWYPSQPQTRSSTPSLRRATPRRRPRRRRNGHPRPPHQTQLIW